MPAKSRNRRSIRLATNDVLTAEKTSPLKKRYTKRATTIPSSPATQLPTCCPRLRRRIDRDSDKRPSKALITLTTPTPVHNVSTLNGSSLVDLIQKTNLPMKNSAPVAPTVKFFTTPPPNKEVTSISIASALKYPTKLMPLTAEERKLNTIQQLIAEKLRLLRREKLVLLKSPKPNPHESEIFLTVVEVSNAHDSTTSEDTVDYAVLQEDIADSPDLLGIILTKINQKTIPNEKSKSSPALTRLRQKNSEYAKQIEAEVLKNITTARKQLFEQKDSEPLRDKRLLYVMFVDGDDIKDEEPSLQLPEDISDNDRREREFTDLFDNIFQKLSKESKKRRMSKSSDDFEQKSKKIKVVEWQRDVKDLQKCDKKGNNLQFYPCTVLDGQDSVPIGPNGTEIPEGSFLKINWWEWPTGYCTRKRLPGLLIKGTHNLRTIKGDKITKGDSVVNLSSDTKVEANVKDVHQAVLAKCYASKASRIDSRTQ